MKEYYYTHIVARALEITPSAASSLSRLRRAGRVGERERESLNGGTTHVTADDYEPGLQLRSVVTRHAQPTVVYSRAPTRCIHCPLALFC